MKHFMRNSLLCAVQFGFISGRSTISQLILCLSDLYVFDMGVRTEIVYAAYAKAFHVVCHEKLRVDFEKYDIVDSYLKWIDHSHVDEVFKWELEMVAPPHTQLRPVWFLIYINHISDSILCSSKLFADGLKIYLSLHATACNSHIP